MSAPDMTDPSVVLSELSQLEKNAAWQVVKTYFDTQLQELRDNALNPLTTPDAESLVLRRVAHKLNELSPTAMLETLKDNYRAKTNREATVIKTK